MTFQKFLYKKGETQMGLVKNSAEIKSLETRRNKLQTQRKMLNIEIQDKQKESNEMKMRINGFQKKIEQLKSQKNDDLIISEHAMLRYIERVMGIDLQDLQDKILPKDKIQAVEAMGNCTYSLGEHKITVKDGVVVTVIGVEHV